jgi:hypothetical protein
MINECLFSQAPGMLIDLTNLITKIPPVENENADYINIIRQKIKILLSKEDVTAIHLIT